MTIKVSVPKTFANGVIVLDNDFVGDVVVSDPLLASFSNTLDYSVLEEGGEIRIYRVETGLIEAETRLKVTKDGQEVLRMFGSLPYLSFPLGSVISAIAPVSTVTYTEGTDYNLDPLTGVLTSRFPENGGRIRNATVTVDYVAGEPEKVYATISDFIDRFEMSEAVELTNLDTAKDPTYIRCTKLWKALEHATAIIKSKLSPRFDIEDLVADSIEQLQWICLDIARYWLDELRQREDVRQRYEDALMLLKDMMEGKASLGTVEESPSGSRVRYGKGSSKWANNLEGF